MIVAGISRKKSYNSSDPITVPFSLLNFLVSSVRWIFYDRASSRLHAADLDTDIDNDLDIGIDNDQNI